MLYEIVNMSDPYTIEAKSLDVAFVACIFLGSGQYAFRPIGDDKAEEIPFFVFGGTEEWCQKHLGKSLKDVVDTFTTERAIELAECFESCVIGNAENRDAYYTGLQLIDDPAKREAWRNRWQDKRCSSLNDIGARAYAMARKLRAGKRNPLIRSPRQVFAS